MPVKNNPLNNTIVLDSWAIVAYLQDEPAGKQIGDWIADVIEAGGDVLVSVVNLGEVWYIFAREQSSQIADSVVMDLLQLGVQFIEVDWTLAKIAATFKTRGRISYADTFAAALAHHRQCDLVTGDAEFQILATDISIRWAK